MKEQEALDTLSKDDAHFIIRGLFGLAWRYRQAQTPEAKGLIIGWTKGTVPHTELPPLPEPPPQGVAACVPVQKESSLTVSTPPNKEGALSLENTTYRFRITRVNGLVFMVTDTWPPYTSESRSSRGYGHVSFGVEYMRSRGCIITDVDSLSATDIKVTVSGGDKDCLPELK